MKRFFKEITSRYHLWVMLIMFIATFGVVLSADFLPDDYFYMQPAVSSAQVWLQFMKWHMTECNGRTLIHAIVLLLLRNNVTQFIWRVLCPLGFVLMCVFASKMLFEQKNDYRIGICVGTFLLMTIRPNLFNTNVYFLTGWCNYCLPIFLLTATMFLSVKNVDSKWLLALAFLGGATMEQTGMMFIGWFTLLFLHELISNKRFNRNVLVSVILSVAGYLSVILSPGTLARIKLQSTLEKRGVLTDLLIMVRKLWIDNLSMYVLVFAMLFAVCFWLVYFNRKTRKGKAFSITVCSVLFILFVANTLLKVYLMLNDAIFGNEIVFSNKVNSLIMCLWILYAVLFIGSLLYSGAMIYIKLHNLVVPAVLILGGGSQILTSLTGTLVFRVCFPGICCFIIFCVFSIVYAINEITQLNEKQRWVKNKKRPMKAIKVLLVCACFVGCLFQFYSGVFGECLFKTEKQHITPMTSEEMTEMTTMREKQMTDYYGSGNADLDITYDPTNFSLYK